MDTPAARFTLRQLPLPAKLVVSTFLLAVGVGYTSAMVQLHMQHGERDGNPLPTPNDVVAVFAGKVWKAAGDPAARSRLEEIISGDPGGGLTAKNMAPAFFAQDDADYRKQAQDPARKPQLDAERNGERWAVVAWVKAPDEARRKGYEEDNFLLPADRAKAPVSPAYADKAKPGAVKIKQLLQDRCVRCHQPGGDKGDVPLTTYEELAKHVSAGVVVPPGGGWVDSGRRMSLEKLTQSTHAHLLSFAMLFALTGLAFAFTSYPGVVRGVLGPAVLIAQFADVSLWWLARLPEPYGPNLAWGIIATGGLVGLGLGFQIVLTLFNLYGPKGKAVLVGLFLLAGGVGGLLYVSVVAPHLAAERAARAAAAAQKPADEAKQKPADNGNGGPPAPAGPSRLERLLTGEYSPKGPFNGKKDGGMVRAFFNKDDTFDEEQTDERKSEQALVLAWLKTEPGARKAAYEADRFPLPADLAGKPFHAQFRADAAGIKVKTLFDTRCAVCHSPGRDVEKYPLDSYEGIEKYLKPEPAGAAGDGAKPPAVEPVPPGKD
ncbi:MAG: hypothetical protein K2X87_01480 [Gemmataceae bacterium]|nr:hypothetical protein [Gemmataceae bacterium]